VQRKSNTVVQQNCVKYVEIPIDNKLDYSDHLNHLKWKIACSIKILCNPPSEIFFPKEVLLQLYHALVYHHLLYAIPVRGSIQNLTAQNSVSPKQNYKNYRLSGKHWDTSAIPYYKQLGILSYENIYKLEVAKIMHTFWNK